jgi:methyl-accepting chemotaxis protein
VNVSPERGLPTIAGQETGAGVALPGCECAVCGQARTIPLRGASLRILDGPGWDVETAAMTSPTERPSPSASTIGDPRSGRAASPSTKRPKFQLGILGKTMAAMLIAGLGPLLIVGIITLTQQREHIRSDAELGLQANAQRISGQVDEWIDKNVRALQAAARLPAVQSMQQAKQVDVLTAIHQAYPWMYLVFTISTDGRNVGRSDDKPPADYTDRQYYKDVVMLGKELSWQTLLGKTSKKAALVIAVPVKENGRVVGVLASAMTIEDISQIVATWKAGKTGFAFLVDENTKVVAHPREEFISTPTYMNENRLIAAKRSDANVEFLSFDENGKRILGCVQNTKLHWTVAVRQDEEEVYAPLRSSFLVGLILLFLAVTMVVVISVFSTRMLIRPIVEMTQAADRMSMGELDDRIVSSRSDELGRLAQSLERLRKSMKAAFNRLSAVR